MVVLSEITRKGSPVIEFQNRLRFLVLYNPFSRRPTHPQKTLSFVGYVLYFIIKLRAFYCEKDYYYYYYYVVERIVVCRVRFIIIILYTLQYNIIEANNIIYSSLYYYYHHRNIVAKMLYIIILYTYLTMI